MQSVCTAVKDLKVLYGYTNLLQITPAIEVRLIIILIVYAVYLLVIHRHMQTQVLEDVCDASCQQSNQGRLLIRCSSPPAAVVTDNTGMEVYRVSYYTTIAIHEYRLHGL